MPSEQPQKFNAFQEASEQDAKFKEFCEEEMRKIEAAFGNPVLFEDFDATRREIYKHFFDPLYTELMVTR